MNGKLVQGPLLILRPKDKLTGAVFLWIYRRYLSIWTSTIQVHFGYDG